MTAQQELKRLRAIRNQWILVQNKAGVDRSDIAGRCGLSLESVREIIREGGKLRKRKH